MYKRQASAMVHLPSSRGDKENTFRYFVHKSNTCSHSPGENVVLLNAAESAQFVACRFSCFAVGLDGTNRLVGDP